MCRLAIYGTMPFKPLARALNQLEHSYGGDGNGVLAVGADIITKGVSLTTGEIAYDTHDVEDTHVFHTRYATVGGRVSRLNHPFYAGEWSLAHNGHWHESYDWMLKEDSDTEVAARLVSECGPGVLLEPEFDGSGVWIVANPEMILVIPRSTRGFKFQFLNNGGFFHASERIKNLNVVKSFSAKPDSVYAVCPRSGAVEKIAIPNAPMPPSIWDYYDYAPAFGSTATNAQPDDDTLDADMWRSLEVDNARDYDPFFDGIATTDWDS